MPEIDEESLYSTQAAQIRAAQSRFEDLISDITGWRGVGDLAEWVVELLISNQGGSTMRAVRPPCWRTHAPIAVAKFTDMLVQASGRPSDDPVIQAQAVTYQQELRDRFGL